MNKKLIIYTADGALFSMKLHALLHEQSQLETICLLYEAAICYHNEKSENECGLLILKKKKICEH